MPDGADAFLDLIKRKLNDNPRSRQRALGPSELGHPCARWLAYRLSGTPKGPELPPWRQTVGIALDELIVIEALSRHDAIAHLVEAMGSKAAVVLPATEAYCHRCQYYSPNSRDLSTGCPGASGDVHRPAVYSGATAQDLLFPPVK